MKGCSQHKGGLEWGATPFQTFTLTTHVDIGGAELLHASAGSCLRRRSSFVRIVGSFA